MKTGIIPSATKVRDLLKDLLQTLRSTFLIIDGLDECDGVHQRQLLSDLRTFLPSEESAVQDQATIKFLICSRETKEILRILRKAPQVFLTKEKAKVSKDIAIFTKDGLSLLRDRFEATVIEEVEQDVVNKADGEHLGYANRSH